MNFGTIEPKFKIPEFQSSKILKMTQRQATSFESAFILSAALVRLSSVFQSTFRNSLNNSLSIPSSILRVDNALILSPRYVFIIARQRGKNNTKGSYQVAKKPA